MDKHNLCCICTTATLIACIQMFKSNKTSKNFCWEPCVSEAPEAHGMQYVSEWVREKECVDMQACVLFVCAGWQSPLEALL